MRLTRNKWWGKHGRFRRQMMVLYGRVRDFSKPYMSAVMDQVKALYRKAQRSENSILDRINIFIPIALTALIGLGCIIFAPWHVFSAASIRNLVFMFAGVWGFYGIIIAGRRTAEFAKQVRIQEQGQVADRLARAAEQLSSEIMSIRILAIVSLGKIAVGVDKQICRDVVKVLCAYIRENRSIGQEDTKSANSKSPMPGDIQEILNVLGGIKTKTDWKIVMDLSNTNLSGAYLSGAKLLGANLWRADLSSADLECADLSGANLWDAKLSGANLGHAKLSGANLRYAKLSQTFLVDTDLSGADLSGADLSDAKLMCANLSSANLLDADLQFADLQSADLQFAILHSVNLSSAILHVANLSYADLSSAILSDAILHNANLSEVKGLDTAKNLETVKIPPKKILEEIERRKQSGQK